jgi:hypothetical protein
MKVEVVSAGGTSRFPYNDPKDFDFTTLSIPPVIIESEDKFMFFFGPRMIDAMYIARLYTANDELRPQMCYVVVDNDYIVASDAHKLYRYSIEPCGKQVLFPVNVIRLFHLLPDIYRIYQLSAGRYMAVGKDAVIWWQVYDDKSTRTGEMCFSSGIRVLLCRSASLSRRFRTSGMLQTMLPVKPG